VPARQVAGLAGDLVGQVLVEQKMLAERFARVQAVAGDDVAEGRGGHGLNLKRKRFFFEKKNQKTFAF
jgi:hypothetical protein